MGNNFETNQLMSDLDQARTLSNSEDFYKNLKSFADFSDILNNLNFMPLPDDWIIYISDVKDSTKAIERGEYQKVNLVGAASISSILNLLKSLSFPYVFGGDGATFAIPEKYAIDVDRELAATASLAKNQFGLTLRVGRVSINTIRQQGQNIFVGKYELSKSNYLAQFKGGGLALAEKLIKSQDSSAELSQSGAVLIPDDLSENTSPNLNGLSCRWQPIKSANGEIVTLLIASVSKNPEIENKIYSEILKSINSITKKHLDQLNPVSLEKLKGKLSFSKAIEESKTQRGKVPLAVFFPYMAIRQLITFSLFRFFIPIGAFRPEKYLKEFVINSDYKKFDDMIRMIIDCSKAQADSIENYLNTLAEEKKIKFGMHRSKTATITCLVQSAVEGKHIHFIDGGDGGYTAAAKKLKSSTRPT